MRGWAWGWNGLTNYGLTKGFKSYIPTQVMQQHKWKSIAIGFEYNFYGIREDGSLWAIGKSDAGQMGIGVTTDKDYMFPLVQVGKDLQWQTIETGIGFVIGLKRDGTIWGWGTN